MGNQPPSPLPPSAVSKIANVSKGGSNELSLDDIYDLRCVPSTVSILSQLQKLSIARCRVAKLTDFSSLGQLRELTMSFNLLNDGCDWKQLSHLSNLRLLDLSHNAHLTVVPPVVVTLTSLQVLNVSFTHITTLPSSISSLASLTSLDASCAKMTSIPASLWELTALLELNIYFNRIASFPARVPGRTRGLLKLRRLTISQNAFASLPEDLFEGMADLAHLDCWENLLTALPESITQCTRMSVLLATHNRLTSYPSNFSRLSALTIANFDNNALTSLPPLATFTQVNKLTIRGNAISTLPTYVPPLPSLQTLDLRDNPFATVPEAFARDYKVVLTSVPNQVMPNLYISGQAGVENFDWLKANRIALIINMAAEITPKYPTKFNYCCVPCMDSDRYPVTSHFAMTNSLIDTYVQQGKNVLVHCAQGRSRSGAVVVAYAMWKLRQNFETALQTIRRGRPMVQPNWGFAFYMRQWGAQQGLNSPPDAPSRDPNLFITLKKEEEIKDRLALASEQEKERIAENPAKQQSESKT